MTAVGDDRQGDPFLDGLAEQARQLLVPDIRGPPPPVRRDNGRVVSGLLRRAEIAHERAMTCVIKQADIAGLGAIDQVLLDGAQDLIRRCFLVRESLDVALAESELVHQEGFHRVPVAHGAVERVKRRPFGIPFDRDPLDGAANRLGWTGLCARRGVIFVDSDKERPPRFGAGWQKPDDSAQGEESYGENDIPSFHGPGPPFLDPSGVQRQHTRSPDSILMPTDKGKIAVTPSKGPFMMMLNG